VTYSYCPINYLHQVLLLMLIQRSISFEERWLDRGVSGTPCEIPELSLTGFGPILTHFDSPQAQKITSLCQNLLLLVYRPMEDLVEGIGTAKELTARANLERGCLYMSGILSQASTEQEVKVRVLMPVLFSLKACFSYAHHAPLKHLFESEYPAPVFQAFFSKVQLYKKEFVTPHLTEDIKLKLTDLSTRATLEWYG
jgi:hypothetical protein